ncbi:hypothetical protein IVA86_33145 [Bradyrhizobium sp. 146]|uniref:phage tail tip lysozyme n=1 Tax=Bradyrhizobium sp. 146 TaxID=2782622 RepID=UPI001FFC10AF|nr:phage tail tip lysozyme [Bradyrhizobium sp. 146]MCK1706120.1 hypothetical protein [Bradyrhizobium sp. 146]
MATGTGLPIPTSAPVLTQAPGVSNADALFNAESWSRIGAASSRLADSASDYLKVTTHQAHVGYLSDSDNADRRKRIELQDQFADNPQAFDQAWKGYSDGKLSEAEPWAVNHVRSTLGSEGNSAYASVLNTKHQAIQAQAKQSWTALEDTAANDVTGAAMAGTLMARGPNGEIQDPRVVKYLGVLDAGVGSQFLQKEEADRRLANLESTATVYATRSAIKTTFEADGPLAAVKQIDGITRDENLKLSPEQRLTLSARLRADVHGWDAERQQNLSTVDLEAQSILKAKQGGISIPEGRVADVMDRYKRFGGQAQAASFLSDMVHTESLSFLGRAPLSEASAWIDQYATSRGFNAPAGGAKTAMDYFQSQGWTKEQAAGIVGNLVHESGLNPSAVHDQGTGLGIAGHRLERLDAMRQFAQARGKPVTDFQTQLEFVNQELNTTEAGAGAKVRAARTPQEAAAAFINFERPQGYDPANIAASHGYTNRVNQATALANARGAPGPDPKNSPGLLEPGNIDLANRPQVKNSDGSVSTVRSLGVNIDGKEVLIPTVVGNQVLSDDEAIAHYKKTGEHLGKFDTVEHANAFAEKLHNMQDDYYRPRPQQPTTTASDTAFIGKANAVVAKRVSDEADTIIAQMADKTNPILPSEQRMNDLLGAAAATNTPEVLQKVAQAAGDYQFRRQFGRAPEPQEQAAVSAMQQKAQTEGLSSTDARRLEIATGIRDQTAKALQDDPLAHSIKALGEVSGLPVPAPLDTANPVQFRAGLAARAQWAALGTQTYQTAPMPALTSGEVTQVRAALDAADPAGKARIYSDIVGGLPPQTRSATLAQLGTKGVGGMVEAFAGGLTGADPAIGESIIRGQAAMKVNEKFNPMKDSKDTTNGALDKYLPPSTFSLAGRTDPNGQYATIRGAVIARAADLAATDPNFKGDFTDTQIQRAVNDVTGGVVTHNGAKLITPIRGMNQQWFDMKMFGLTDNDLQGAMTQSGTPVTADYIRNSAQLESLSDGRYLVRLGRDPERPIYAFRDLGVSGPGRLKPFILDMRPIAPKTIGPDRFDLSQALP